METCDLTVIKYHSLAGSRMELLFGFNQSNLCNSSAYSDLQIKPAQHTAIMETFNLIVTKYPSLAGSRMELLFGFNQSN